MVSWIDCLLEDSELEISLRLQWLPNPLLFCWRLLYFEYFPIFPPELLPFYIYPPAILCCCPFHPFSLLGTTLHAPGTPPINHPLPRSMRFHNFAPSLCLEWPSPMLSNSCSSFGRPSATLWEKTFPPPLERDFHSLPRTSRILHTYVSCCPYYITVNVICLHFSSSHWTVTSWRPDCRLLRVFKKLLNEKLLSNWLRRISSVILRHHASTKSPFKVCLYLSMSATCRKTFRG